MRRRPALFALLIGLSLAACSQTKTQDAGLDQQPALEEPGAQNPGEQPGITNPPGNGATDPPDNSSPGHPAGSLDTSFGGDGVVTSPLPEGMTFHTTSVSGSGRVLVVGGIIGAGGDSDLAVTRYLANGELDTSFGNGGLATAGQSSEVDYASGVEFGRAALERPDGQVLAASAGIPHTGGELFEFQANGALSTGFGQDGSVVTVAYRALALQEDGKAVAVSGEAGSLSWSIGRYLEDGILDPGFAGGQVVTVDVRQGGDGLDWGSDVAVAPDGKITAVGGTGNEVNGPGSQPSQVVLVRLNPDGSRDTSFSGDGMAFTSSQADTNPLALALTSDGGVAVLALGQQGIEVYRFSSSGELVASFGQGGRVALGSLSPGSDSDITADEGDRLLVAGMTEDSGQGSSSRRIAVLRLTSSGSLDASFDGDGIAVVPSDVTASASRIALTTGGRITVSGTELRLTEGGGYRISGLVIARLWQ